MWNKILAILATIGAALSAIFFVLFKESHEMKRQAEEENRNLSDNLDALKEADKAEMEKKKENEELVRRVTGSNRIDSFDACNDLLQK